MKSIREKKKQGKPIAKAALIACALAAVMAIGGASAYFTATDDKTNTWTVGNIDVELQEPLYDAAEDERENITPNKELTKDPQIVNKGNNDAFVFLKVTIPVADVKVASQDGSTMTEAEQELFDFAINNGWTKISEEADDSNNKVYVYAYGTADKCTALAPDATTPVLFKDSKIKFKNVVEGQGLEGTTLSIPVEAYAIQTSDITENDTDDPAGVWSVLTASNSGK